MNTDDIFEIIEDDLENEVANMTMIHENPLEMKFSLDSSYDAAVVLKEVLFICNLFFPKTLVNYNSEKKEENDSFFYRFHHKKFISISTVLTFEFPENVFVKVQQTIEFLKAITNIFKERKYEISIRNRFATYYFKPDIFKRQHNGKLMTIDVISRFISLFFTSEERQRYAFESYFGVPLDVYAVKGAAYVCGTERYENKYNEMEDITDEVPEVIGKRVAIKSHLIGSARIGVQGGNQTYAHYEGIPADKIHRIVVMSQESNRNPKFATVVMTLSEPYFKKSQNTFNVMYTNSQVVIDNGEMNYHDIVERFLKKVCECWVFA
jgi:hypothetical protein